MDSGSTFFLTCGMTVARLVSPTTTAATCPLRPPVLRCAIPKTGVLELPPIGWQLFILGSSQSDPTAFPPFLDTYATRLLAEPLSSSRKLSHNYLRRGVQWLRVQFFEPRRSM